MAAAEATYVDPSALLKLYVHQPESFAMSAWRARTRGALPVTHHARAEVLNGICLAAFRRDISAIALRDALASLEAVEREAVIRRVVLEESYRAIAADLRCSEPVVRKRVSRGLARLRESLEGR